MYLSVKWDKNALFDFLENQALEMFETNRLSFDVCQFIYT